MDIHHFTVLMIQLFFSLLDNTFLKSFIISRCYYNTIISHNIDDVLELR